VVLCCAEHLALLTHKHLVLSVECLARLVLYLSFQEFIFYSLYFDWLLLALLRTHFLLLFCLSYKVSQCIVHLILCPLHRLVL